MDIADKVSKSEKFSFTVLIAWQCFVLPYFLLTGYVEFPIFVVLWIVGCFSMLDLQDRISKVIEAEQKTCPTCGRTIEEDRNGS